MSIFSNYPGDPPMDGRDPIPEEEEIQKILEDPSNFSFDETTNEDNNVWMVSEKIDRVMEIVAGLVDQINPDCPRCEEAAMKQEAECQASGEEWERQRFVPNLLECGMCGASNAFVINPQNQAEGFCFQEQKIWTVSKV